MSIPGLGALKTWGMVGLSFALLIVSFLFKSEQAARAKEKLKGEIQARKTGQAVNKEIMEGVNDEQDAVDKARDSDGSDRTGFEQL